LKFRDFPQCRHVTVRKIANVEVISNSTDVWSGMISAIDLELRPCTDGKLSDIPWRRRRKQG
jgi:hypothetical protein